MTTAKTTAAAPAVNFFRVIGNGAGVSEDGIINHGLEIGDIVRLVLDDGTEEKGYLSLTEGFQWIHDSSLVPSSIQEAMAYHSVTPEEVAERCEKAGTEPAEPLYAAVH